MKKTMVSALVLVLSIPFQHAGAGDRPRCFGRLPTMTGTPGDDVLIGTDDRDVIMGFAGDDVIKGMKDRDLICGGKGNDHLEGNTERDAEGNIGGRFQAMHGGPGHDEMYAGYQNQMFGDQGNDRIYVDGLGGKAVGGAGNDTLDSTESRAGARFHPGPGDDVVIGHPTEYDEIVFRGATEPITLDLGAQTVSGQGIDEISGIDGARGGDFDDTFVGSEERNYLSGGGGADQLDGLGGDDILHGDSRHGTAGSDELRGGDGSDFLLGDHLDPTDDTLDGGEGRDVLAVFASPARVDLAEGTSSGPMIGNDTISGFEDIEGGDSDDVLLGDDGPNVIFGSGGSDHIDGRGGDDTIVGEAGPGIRYYAQDDDVIIGGDGNDTITAEQGMDDIDAGAGDDSVDAGRGGDQVDGGEGIDTVDGNSGTDGCYNSEVTTNCEDVSPGMASRWPSPARRRS